MLESDAGKGHHTRRAQKKQASGGDAGSTKTGDQTTGKEAWHIHGQHMPLQGKSGIIHRQAAIHHGNGTCRHHKVHQAIRDHAREHGGQKTRIT